MDFLISKLKFKNHTLHSYCLDENVLKLHNYFNTIFFLFSFSLQSFRSMIKVIWMLRNTKRNAIKMRKITNSVHFKRGTDVSEIHVSNVTHLELVRLSYSCLITQTHTISRRKPCWATLSPAARLAAILCCQLTVLADCTHRQHQHINMMHTKNVKNCSLFCLLFFFFLECIFLDNEKRLRGQLLAVQFIKADWRFSSEPRRSQKKKKNMSSTHPQGTG